MIRAIRELLNVTFHVRQSIDVCMSNIARLESYANAPAIRRDSPIKIRQDLLATHDVVDLAINSRRLVEITRMTKFVSEVTIDCMELKMNNDQMEVLNDRLSLKNLIDRIIHSKFCVASRNSLEVLGHFDINKFPSSLLDGKMATHPALIIESDKYAKRACSIVDYYEAAFRLVERLSDNNKEISEYLKRRNF